MSIAFFLVDDHGDPADAEAVKDQAAGNPNRQGQFLRERLAAPASPPTGTSADDSVGQRARGSNQHVRKAVRTGFPLTEFLDLGRDRKSCPQAKGVVGTVTVVDARSGKGPRVAVESGLSSISIGVWSSPAPRGP